MPDLPYQVFNSSGERVMHTQENCQYSRRIELDMLENGYTIKLNGKRITKTEARKMDLAQLVNNQIRNGNAKD